MKDIRDIPVVWDVVYSTQITRMYQPVLDALLIVSAMLHRHGQELCVREWHNLGFQFRYRNKTANAVNALWRELSHTLETVDTHWTVVYSEDMFECTYELDKVL